MIGVMYILRQSVSDHIRWYGGDYLQFRFVDCL